MLTFCLDWHLAKLQTQIVGSPARLVLGTSTNFNSECMFVMTTRSWLLAAQSFFWLFAFVKVPICEPGNLTTKHLEFKKVQKWSFQVLGPEKNSKCKKKSFEAFLFSVLFFVLLSSFITSHSKREPLSTSWSSLKDLYSGFCTLRWIQRWWSKGRTF